MRRGHVLLKHSGNPRNDALELTVPTAIVRAYRLEPGLVFEPVVTDEGILFRPVDPEPMPPPVDTRPAWLR